MNNLPKLKKGSVYIDRDFGVAIVLEVIGSFGKVRKDFKIFSFGKDYVGRIDLSEWFIVKVLVL
mgnify:CR=1 FL=1